MQKRAFSIFSQFATIYIGRHVNYIKLFVYIESFAFSYYFLLCVRALSLLEPKIDFDKSCCTFFVFNTYPTLAYYENVNYAKLSININIINISKTQGRVSNGVYFVKNFIT